jgi:hypothetical protein
MDCLHVDVTTAKASRSQDIRLDMIVIRHLHASTADISSGARPDVLTEENNFACHGYIWS